MRNNTMFMIRNKNNGLFTTGTRYYALDWVFNHPQLIALKSHINSVRSYSKHFFVYCNWKDPFKGERVELFEEKRDAWTYILKVVNILQKEWKNESASNGTLAVLGVCKKKEWIKDILQNVEIIPVYISISATAVDLKTVVPKYLKDHVL